MAQDTAFGQWLRQQRKVRDLTQEELAMKVDCSWETVRKFESGTRRPSRQVAELLADFFSIDPEDRADFIKFARSDAGAERFISVAQPHPQAEAVHPHNNLPVQRTTFIGRESVVSVVSALLRRPTVRLVTLTGPPGMGKTRLSLQVAANVLDDFANGVFFVQLAPVTDPGAVATAIAQTLDIKDTSIPSPAERLKSYLRDKRVLLVLDNFEQVVQAGRQVAELLEKCASLKVLVTSREVLRVYGEHEFPVPPMTLPDKMRLPTLEVLEQLEAVDLFIERAQAVKPEFSLTEENAPLVAEICRRLEGMPLAIELAAARSNVLPPQAILSRLDSRLQLLTTGALDLAPRQRTLRNAIAWSYDLLDAQDQALFRRLGIFVGGCTLEAAEAVALPGAGDEEQVHILDRMASFVNKSLVKQEEGALGEPRFNMLETIQEYALEKLKQSGELEEITKRHTTYFLALAEEAEPRLAGPEQAEWLERLADDHNNMRVGLERNLAEGDTETVLRLASALYQFWVIRGYLTEGRLWLGKVLEASSSSPSHLRANVVNQAAALALLQGDLTWAQTFHDQALSIGRKLEDKQIIAESLFGLGDIALRLGDYLPARGLFEESFDLYEELRDLRGISACLDALSYVSRYRGDYASAQDFSEKNLRIQRQIGDPRREANALAALGVIYHLQGNHEAAQKLFERGLTIRRNMKDSTGTAAMLHALGFVALAREDHSLARSLFGESLALYEESGSRTAVADSLGYLGLVEFEDGNPSEALLLLKRSLALYGEMGLKGFVADCLDGLAVVANDLGRPLEAARLLGAAEGLRERIGSPPRLPRSPKTTRCLSELQDRLSEPAFAEEWALGKRIPIEEVVDYAQHFEANSAPAEQLVSAVATTNREREH